MNEPKPNIGKIAAIITIVRLAVLPLILLFYLSGAIIDVQFFAEYGKLIALILFVGVIVAGVIVRHFAKKHNKVTDSLEEFARITNKLVMLVGLVLVATDFQIWTGWVPLAELLFLPMPSWFAAIVLIAAFGRDLIISSVRAFAIKKGIKPAADKFLMPRKIALYVAISLLMFYAFAAMHSFLGLGNVHVVVQIYEFAAVFTLVTATVLSIVAACVYLYQHRELFTGNKPKKDWGETPKKEEN